MTAHYIRSKINGSKKEKRQIARGQRHGDQNSKQLGKKRSGAGQEAVTFGDLVRRSRVFAVRGFYSRTKCMACNT